MSTRAKIVVFSLVGLLIAGGIAATVVILLVQKGHKDDIAAADRVAAGYADEVADFREEKAELLRDAYDDSPDAMRAVVDEARDELPTIGDAPKYGRENSDDYADAAELEQQLLDDLDAIEALADLGDEVVGFIETTNAALDTQAAQDRLGTGPFSDGSHVRDVVLPPEQTKLTDYQALTPPEGFDEAYEATIAALQHMVSNLETMAASLDSGQDFSFQFDPPYANAHTELDAAIDDITKLFEEAIDAFGQGDPIDAPPGSDDDEDDA